MKHLLLTLSALGFILSSTPSFAEEHKTGKKEHKHHHGQAKKDAKAHGDKGMEKSMGDGTAPAEPGHM